jgi:hypothetical protein
VFWPLSCVFPRARVCACADDLSGCVGCGLGMPSLDHERERALCCANVHAHITEVFLTFWRFLFRVRVDDLWAWVELRRLV